MSTGEESTSVFLTPDSSNSYSIMVLILKDISVMLSRLELNSSSFTLSLKSLKFSAKILYESICFSDYVPRSDRKP